MRENAMPLVEHPDLVTQLAREAYAAECQVVEAYLKTQHPTARCLRWERLPRLHQEARKHAVTAVLTALRTHQRFAWENEMDEWTLVDEQIQLYENHEETTL